MLYFLFIIAPLFYGIALCVLQKGEYDPMLTVFNDEIGYHFAVQNLHSGGAKAYSSYNEVFSTYPSLGAYGLVPYLPYALLSYLTMPLFGYRYFTAANIIMIILAHAVLIKLLKPGKIATLFLLLSFLCSFQVQRYIWSGMSETNFIFFAIVTFSISAALLNAKKEAGKRMIYSCIGAMIVLNSFYSAMRPYYLVFDLIVILFLYYYREKFSRKGLYAFISGLGVFSLASLITFFWSGANISARYFNYQNSSVKMRIQSLFVNGGPVYNTLKLNYKAVRLVVKSGDLFCVPFLAFLFVEFVLMLALFLKLYKKNRIEGAYFGTLLLCGIFIFESVVILYAELDASRLMRMMLGIGIFWIYAMAYYYKKASAVTQMQAGAGIMIAVLAISFYPLMGNGDGYKLPVTDNYRSHEIVCIKRKEQLTKLIPESSRPEDNTIAILPEFSGIEIYFSIPSYASASCCLYDYLQNAIGSDRLKCKYVCLAEDELLNELCEEKGYIPIYHEAGHIIWQVR